MQVDSPVHAAEQVVVFRAGEYVAMIQLASSLSASNPTALTPSQAVAVSVGQYWSLGKGDPVGSRDQPAPPTGGASGATWGPWPPRRAAASVPVIVAAAAVAAVMRRCNPRPPPATPPAGRPPTRTAIDPWAPGGLFESFGATVPDRTSWDQLPLPAPMIAPIRPAAREVPALATAGAARIAFGPNGLLRPVAP